MQIRSSGLKPPLWLESSQEVRLRLERSFNQEDADAARPDIRGLLDEVGAAVNLVEQVAKRHWHEDVETRSLLRHALDTILARYSIVKAENEDQEK
jgi:hypothetical protein